VKLTPTRVAGAFVIDLERREDDRGFFARAWCRRDGAEHGLKMDFVQSNVGFSRSGHTLRGMHYQLAPHAEVKLVRCTRGAVLDVVVDLRPTSSTHRAWFGVELTADNRRSLYLPEGTAHGYLTLTDDSEVVYETTAAYAADAARGVRYNDPAFAIEWPAAPAVISERDRTWPNYGG
jgi:dTDP-4-dehydrorhamnose 3,5-epimerase